MQAQRTPESTRSIRFLLPGAIVMALALVPLFAVSAFADYEQVGNFAQSGEAEQLQEATSMAVNVNGAGGVPAGSVYVVGRNARVLRYASNGEFEEAWGWGVTDGAEAFERCGPALKTTCTPSNGSAPFGGEEVGHFNYPAGVAVDQVTGYVYVLNTGTLHHREKDLVEVFSADGSEAIAQFGDAGAEPPFPASAESIAEGPEKLHEIGETTSGLAVDDAGRVYVTDYDSPRIASPPGVSRVMSFEPQSPGDYEHYVYAGSAQDIQLGPPSATFWRVALDDAGHLYGASGGSIKELSLAEPAIPLCTYKVATADLQSMAVNPVTGEVFYFTGKAKKVHRLGSCDVEKGVFEESQGPISIAPETKQVLALAVNPGLVWGALRPAGVLYGADDEAHVKAVPPLHGSGAIFAPAEVRFPSIESESVVNTGTGTSTLRAEVDPHGFTTHFVFQYLSETAYEANDPANRFAGASVAPAGGGALEGAQRGLATATISGLAPAGEYRFRVIATSECEGAGEPLCEVSGEVATFSTFPAAAPGLPDGRAYELVSPIEKHGGEVFPADPGLGSCGNECKPPGGAIRVRFPMLSAPGGDAVAYEGQPFSATEGAAVSNEYLAKRTASGWHTTALSPALQEKASGGHLAFDAGLTSGLIYQGSPALSPEAPSGYPNIYAQSVAAPGSLTPLLTVAPPNRNAGAFELKYAGHSADFSRQFFTANDALTSETPLAPAAPDPNPGENDLYEWSGGQLRLVNVLPGNTTAASHAAFGSRSPDAHAVSADGSRVFWSDGTGKVYVRERGESTVEVPGSSSGARFLTASADGSRLLLTDGELFDVDDLEQAPIDLTHGEGGFQGIAGQSEDLSHVYFVDTSVLTGEEENGEDVKAQPGKDNLYLWDEGALRFIATLDSSVNEGADWTTAASQRTAEASPAGDWLAFASYAPLTGYDNVGACKLNSVGVFEIAPCSEVFLYDSASGALRCVSCNPTGEAPLGRSALRLIYGAQEWLSQPRYLTDTGRLYFDSSDRLSPLDTNHGVEDVYEFEPQGIGACTQAGGCVVLISTGAGTHDANFLAIDATGANVFFTTRERLVSSDRDELIDLYDARENGGFASETEPGPSMCQGEACQPSFPPAGVSDELSASSSLFTGPGNLLPPLLGASPPVKTKAKPSTRAQKLTSALRSCKKKPRRKRSVCERTARKRYGPTASAKKASGNRKGDRS